MTRQFTDEQIEAVMRELDDAWHSEPDLISEQQLAARLVLEARAERDEWKAKAFAAQHQRIAEQMSGGDEVRRLEAENAVLRGKSHTREVFTSLTIKDAQPAMERIAENERLRVKLDSMPEHKRIRECHYKAPCLECEAQDVRNDLRTAMESDDE